MSFETEMANDLMGYAPSISYWIRNRFPNIYTEALAFDAHSSAMLDILQRGYTGMSADEIKRSMFNIAGRAVLQTYQEHQCREAIRTGVDTPTKKLVRIEKLDERYAASLTPLRRSIYDMTCSGLSISQIADALQRSKNLVVVERHNIRRMYVVWLRRVYPFQTTWLNRLPKLAHMNDVVRARYVDGAAIPDIAKKTGITANHVRVLLYFARKYLKQKRITVLP